MEHIEIVINGKTITIPKYLKERCDKYGVDIFGEYANKITETCSPYYKVNTSMNVFNALYEKLYRDKFGPFVQIENGTVIKESYELYDLLKEDPDKKHTYNLSYFYKKGMNPRIENYDFYGCNIRRFCYEGIEEEPRPYMLNDLIKTNLKYAKKLAKGDQDIYQKDLVWRCFNICRLVHDWYSGFLPKDFQESRSEDEYNKALSNLLMRYSKDNQTLFEKVDNLTNYKDFIGIYVLCIESKRMIYVGQATVSLQKRIIQHLTDRHTAFDNSVFPNEINEIYVLTTPQNYEMIDRLESDGIATVGKIVTGNASASSYTLEGIPNESYDPNYYLLDSEEIKKYISVIKRFKKTHPMHQ